MFCCNPDLEAALVEQTQYEYAEHQADLVSRDFHDAMTHGSCTVCLTSDHFGLRVDGPDLVCEDCLGIEDR